MGLTGIPPLLVIAAVPFLPESPRWHLERMDIKSAYKAMKKLRRTDYIAARDLYVSIRKLAAEKAVTGDGSTLSILRRSLKTRRTLRAFQSSWFVMAMQQMCGGK